MENNIKNKTTKAATKPLTGYSFFYKTKEYVVEAESASKARALFNQLINKK